MGPWLTYLEYIVIRRFLLNAPMWRASISCFLDETSQMQNQSVKNEQTAFRQLIPQNYTLTFFLTQRMEPV
ncbi:hypothetical protein J22TS1_31270 [Siminovitchia terrae]|nr:hypothetical protein J22TS1_31270 [Siminovitchia terrae]